MSTVTHYQCLKTASESLSAFPLFSQQLCQPEFAGVQDWGSWRGQGLFHPPHQLPETSIKIWDTKLKKQNKLQNHYIFVELGVIIHICSILTVWILLCTKGALLGTKGSCTALKGIQRQSQSLDLLKNKTKKYRLLGLTRTMLFLQFLLLLLRLLQDLRRQLIVNILIVLILPTSSLQTQTTWINKWKRNNQSNKTYIPWTFL